MLTNCIKLVIAIPLVEIFRRKRCKHMELFTLYTVDFSSLVSSRRTIESVDFTDLLKCSFYHLVCVVNFTLCCSGQLLVCNLAPCCPARLYCLFYVLFCCVLSKINDDETKWSDYSSGVEHEFKASITTVLHSDNHRHILPSPFSIYCPIKLLPTFAWRYLPHNSGTVNKKLSYH